MREEEAERERKEEEAAAFARKRSARIQMKEFDRDGLGLVPSLMAAEEAAERRRRARQERVARQREVGWGILRAGRQTGPQRSPPSLLSSPPQAARRREEIETRERTEVETSLRACERTIRGDMRLVGRRAVVRKAVHRAYQGVAEGAPVSVARFRHALAAAEAEAAEKERSKAEAAKWLNALKQAAENAVYWERDVFKEHARGLGVLLPAEAATAWARDADDGLGPWRMARCALVVERRAWLDPFPPSVPIRKGSPLALTTLAFLPPFRCPSAQPAALCAVHAPRRPGAEGAGPGCRVQPRSGPAHGPAHPAQQPAQGELQEPGVLRQGPRPHLAQLHGAVTRVRTAVSGSHRDPRLCHSASTRQSRPSGRAAGRCRASLTG